MARRTAESDLLAYRAPYNQYLLGTALYRSGRYAEARDALHEATPLDSVNSEVGKLFFQAMTAWQLGEQTDARSYYEGGVVRMQEGLPKTPFIIRTRNEAAELLGTQP